MRNLRFLQVLEGEVVVVFDETSISETIISFPIEYQKFFVLDRVPLIFTSRLKFDYSDEI